MNIFESSSWIASAWDSMLAARQHGGMMGALQNSKYSARTSKGFMRNSMLGANALATIASSNVVEMNNLKIAAGVQRIQKAQQERIEAALKAATSQANKPFKLPSDPVIHFANGSSLDTSINVLTMSDGTKIDTTTGLKVVDTSSIVQLANGAYLDTKNNILTMSNGTRIDTVTGLVVSTTA